ncbi:MFS transporter [Streptomyces sp. NPDC018045]|uniref:MFS transporter n=1 Tax=Streptomyces sp. NPDC018045 TaxID=3365037 RepID=UPI0037A3E84B
MPDARRWTALAVMLCGTLLANLDVFIVVVAVPSFSRDLGAGAGQQQMVLAGYQLVYALGLITGGRLGDRYGIFRVFAAGMAVFVLASVGCALAPTAAALVTARLVQGAGTALLVPQVYSAARTLFGEREQRAAFAATGVVMGLGAVSGQLLGGWLIGADLFGLGWRSVFWVNVPIGLAALCALPFVAVRGGRRRMGLDGAGLLLGAVALAAFSVPPAFGRDLGWPWWIWVCLVLSVPAGAAFARHERRAQRRDRAPLLPPALLTGRFPTGLLLIALFNSGLNAFFLVLGLHLQQGLGWAPMEAGSAMLPLAGLFAVLSLLVPRLRKVSSRHLLVRGGATAAFGYAAAAGSALSQHPGWLLCSLAVIGAGQGLFITPALTATLRTAPERFAGSASGVVSTVQQTAAAVGVCLLGLIYYGLTDSGTASAPAFALTSIAIAALSACAAALALRLPG